MSYVYVIQAMEGVGRVKIGSSVNPEMRLRELRTGSPVQLRIIGRVKRDDARAAERVIHAELIEYRRHLEWFEFTDMVKAKLLKHGVVFDSDGPAKVCKRCHVLQALTEYRRNLQTKDQLTHVCRSCTYLEHPAVRFRNRA